ncbi:MAG: hypothetical protein ACP5IA_13515 [Sediminispirochaetaceae bacterium]
MTAAVVHISEDQPDSELENILNRTVLIQFEEYGLSGNSLYFTEDISPSSDAAELESFVASSLDHEDLSDTDLLLIGFYSVSDDDLTVKYRLVDTATKSFIASVNIEDRIDLFLDKDISAVVRTILIASSDIIADISARKKAAAETAAAEQPAVSPETASLPAPAGTTAQRGGDQRYTSYASTALPILLGAAAEQFPLAVQITTGFLYRIAGSSLGFSVGLSTGLIRLIPSESYKGSYVRTLIPVGAEAMIFSKKTGPGSWFLYMTAGAAFRIATSDGVSDLLSPALPYTRAGGGISLLPLGRRAELIGYVALSALFNLYQESGSDFIKVDTLLGIAPGVYVRWRW